MEQYHRATAEQFITTEHLEQQNSYNSYNSYNTYNVQQQSRYNSRADTTAITWNGITAKQPKQIKQDNSIKLFLQVWSNINGRMGNEPNYTHN